MTDEQTFPRKSRNSIFQLWRAVSGGSVGDHFECYPFWCGLQQHFFCAAIRCKMRRLFYTPELFFCKNEQARDYLQTNNVWLRPPKNKNASYRQAMRSLTLLPRTALMGDCIRSSSNRSLLPHPLVPLGKWFTTSLRRLSCPLDSCVLLCYGYWLSHLIIPRWGICIEDSWPCIIQLTGLTDWRWCSDRSLASKNAACFCSWVRPGSWPGYSLKTPNMSSLRS